MTTPPTPLNAPAAQQLISQGARLVDIRNADEFARAHIPGALNLPLARLAQLPRQEGAVIFHCQSGMRTQMNAAQLATASAGQPCYILAGGLEGWRQAGLPVALDTRQPLEIMRQVQLAAGGLVLLGVLLGFLVSPWLFALSGFAGAGLMLAGATGWCGMAHVLRHMPWNRAA